jgi:hypothetical protein
MHHRASPLSVDRLGRRRRRRLPRAGDRIPDLPVRVEGRSRRTHELLSYDRWTLLTPGSDDDLARPRRLVAPHPIAVQRVAAAPGDTRGPVALLALVRPDRHIGYLARSTDAHGLRAYPDSRFTAAAPGRDEPGPDRRRAVAMRRAGHRVPRRSDVARHVASGARTAAARLTDPPAPTLLGGWRSRPARSPPTGSTTSSRW